MFICLRQVRWAGVLNSLLHSACYCIKFSCRGCEVLVVLAVALAVAG